MAFVRKFPGFLNPDKPFTSSGHPLGFTALDYWRFQFSNIWDVYEEVAEFLVSRALGIEVPFNKNGWTLWDINYKGKRIEVKSSAKYHPWQEEGKISTNHYFGIQKSAPQDDPTDTVPRRHNDVYVFCLSIGENQADADSFETDHWEFYVVPTAEINSKCGDNKTISIGRIREFAKGVSYDQLRVAVDEALEASS